VRGNVLAMGLVSLLTDFSSEMMNPLLPIFVAGLVGGPMAAIWVGIIEGVAETTAAILKIYSGRISDKTGKRKALVLIGYGASSVARPLTALVGITSLAFAGVQVLALKFFDRVGKGIRTSPRDALIGDSVAPEYRGLAFSFHRSMDHLGAVAGPLVAMAALGLMIGDNLWTQPAMHTRGQAVGPEAMTAMRWIFAFALVPGLAALAALVFMVKETAPKPSGGPAIGSVAGLPRKFYAYVGIVALFALGNSSDMFIVLLAAKKFDMSLMGLLNLWILLHVSKIVFSVPGGLLSDKIGRRPVIVGGWIIYALVYLGFAFSTEQWHFWALVMTYGVFFGMTEGTEKALVADFVPAERRATGFGVYHAAVGMAVLPANLLIGTAWTWLDKWQPGMGSVVAFGAGAALAGTAAVLLTLLLATSRQSK
jgi:MFS family permease